MATTIPTKTPFIPLTDRERQRAVETADVTPATGGLIGKIAATPGLAEVSPTELRTADQFLAQAANTPGLTDVTYGEQRTPAFRTGLPNDPWFTELSEVEKAKLGTPAFSESFVELVTLAKSPNSNGAAFSTWFADHFGANPDEGSARRAAGEIEMMLTATKPANPAFRATAEASLQILTAAVG